MKKYLPAIFLLVLTTSCAQKPNLKDIQQVVFGNLPMGVNGTEYSQQFESIVRNSMSITGSTKYPYFKLENRDLLDYRLTFLFPHAFHNRDSIVTRIMFYLYQVKFVTREVAESPTTTPEQLKYLRRFTEENQNRLSFLTQDFNTRNKIDSQFLFRLPNIGQGLDYNSLEKDITAHLELKYNKPTTTNTAGNEYDKYDYRFFKEQLWKTDKLNIRLVRKRFPVSYTEPSSEFYLVLIYEFNDEVKKEYGLNKEVDLTQTF